MGDATRSVEGNTTRSGDGERPGVSRLVGEEANTRAHPDKAQDPDTTTLSGAEVRIEIRGK